MLFPLVPKQVTGARPKSLRKVTEQRHEHKEENCTYFFEKKKHTCMIYNYMYINHIYIFSHISCTKDLRFRHFHANLKALHEALMKACLHFASTRLEVYFFKKEEFSCLLEILH